MSTMTRTLSWGRGYTGKSGNKCWAARIIGTDATYGMRREFLDADKVERDHFGRERTMIRFSYTLAKDGLYELCENGERWYVTVFERDGEIISGKVNAERARVWAELLESGSSAADARINSKSK